jgi:hypothetical protein
MSAATATCAAIPAQGGYSIEITRMMGLETAASLLGGKPPLADALGIAHRTLRAKLTGERGVSNGDLALAAGALEKQAARMVEHARKLREVAA